MLHYYNNVISCHHASYFSGWMHCCKTYSCIGHCVFSHVALDYFKFCAVRHLLNDIQSLIWCPDGLRGGNVPRFIGWFWHYINCVFTYLSSLLSSFLFLIYLLPCSFTSWLIYLLLFSFRIGPFCFQAGGCMRLPNLALFFWFIRSTPVSWPNKVGLLSNVRPYICQSVHKNVLRFQWNLVCM